MTPEKRKIQRRIEDDMVEIILKRIDEMEKRQEIRDTSIHGRIDKLVNVIHDVDIKANDCKNIACEAKSDIDKHQDTHTKFNVGASIAIVTVILTGAVTIAVALH